MNYSFKRVLAAFALGMILAALFTEISFFFLKKENRPPSVIELIIPAGTADLIRAGETPPEIPNDLRFVVGDTLKVINRDDENHQLGPLWIPANSSATQKMETEENLIVECTFQPGSYMGFTVQEPVTWRTRLSGMFYAGFPMGTIFAVYSGLIGGEKKKKKTDESIS
ncbi:MAG: hypothetical protein LC099_00825 [Anaerolineales bacterium]|nr:hypothetical protein [Anaerolineales bacterium]